MYRYTESDKQFVRERANEFRGQTARRLGGELTEDQFRPLRLMNGLYLQRHAYMLRIAIPYGQIDSRQMRKLGLIADRYDRGFGHFTTRQNLQFNWLSLSDVPDILDHLAEVEMHAIQTSGNCVRNITSDPMAGIAPDELLDVRPYCEALRQYSTCHPEFMYLPRKFKIAMSGAQEDRAAIAFHDIGLRAVEQDGVVGWRVLVGGGLGRTPRVAKMIREFIPLDDVQSYVEAILRVYNLHGRRDNKYKARIKILVGALGADEFRRQVDAEWALIQDEKLDLDWVASIAEQFEDVDFDPNAAQFIQHQERRLTDPGFDRWMRMNVTTHRVAGYNGVYLSLKKTDVPPGDITSDQFRGVADLMDRFNQGYCASVYNQNLFFQYIRNEDLGAVYDALLPLGLATPNIGTLQDMICCPGLDYCSLANASSIPVARALNDHFANLDELYDLGEIQLKMSGCINACGHHHVGHIGILGIDKRGEEFYQIVLGGSAGTTDDDYPAVGEIIGPAVSQDDVPETLERIVDCFVENRQGAETFLQCVRRVGLQPFKDFVYGA